ncbi:TIGR03086 family metal-binding protein [Streptomyces axinellae]|uniref:Maleylpyruvate isomerase family mycothiol-dependent enzyme n=1 Tax=Streptomyces axinellae TaxID=552788 RepID=A0ABN3Q6W7_9ACTN
MAEPKRPRETGTARAGYLGEAAALLERSVGYALGAARSVTPTLLGRPTPCAAWDLGRLLAHMDDSLAALYEGITEGAVALRPRADPYDERAPTQGSGSRSGAGSDPAALFRRRAVRLLGAWAAAGTGHRPTSIAGSPLTAEALALTGAVELAVHGWDITRATGEHDRPLPAALSAALLPVAHQLVPHEAAARAPLFAPVIPLPPGAPPAARLLAFLGRAPEK